MKAYKRNWTSVDKFYERVSVILGHTFVIGLFATWLIVHTFMQKDYISFISELAILIGLLILRAENQQSKRTEDAVKRDLKKSDTQLEKLDGIMKEVKPQR